MSDGDHADLVGFDPVHDLLRKPTDEHPLERHPTTPGFVPLDCVGELLGGGLADEEWEHHRPRISFSIRLFTSSHGSNFMVPASIAATRR